MLKRVEIKDFQSCHDVVLDGLGPMTVLVGRNAVGKTNILRAVQWTADAATAQEITPSARTSGHVSLWADVGNSRYIYSLTVGLAQGLPQGAQAGRSNPVFVESLEYQDGNGRATEILRRNNQDVSLVRSGNSLSIGAFVPCMPALASLMPVDSPDIRLIRPFLSVLAAVRYYPLGTDTGDAIPGFVLETEYQEWLAKYRATGNPGDSVLLRLLHLSLENRPGLEELKATLGPNGLDLVLDIHLHSTTLPKRTAGEEETEKLHVFNFRPNRLPRYFLFGDLSAGTQRIVRLLVSLIFDQSSVLLVEHPEDTIHRGLLRKLIDVLRTYSDHSQLILSSHSSVVFNTLDPTAIRLVTMENGNTKVRPLTNDELSAAGKFIEEEGSLADFIETVEEE